jgi:hypothetical protein
MENKMGGIWNMPAESGKCIKIILPVNMKEEVTYM